MGECAERHCVSRVVKEPSGQQHLARKEQLEIAQLCKSTDIRSNRISSVCNTCYAEFKLRVSEGIYLEDGLYRFCSSCSNLKEDGSFKKVSQEGESLNATCETCLEKKNGKKKKGDKAHSKKTKLVKNHGIKKPNYMTPEEGKAESGLAGCGPATLASKTSQPAHAKSSSSTTTAMGGAPQSDGSVALQHVNTAAPTTATHLPAKVPPASLSPQQLGSGASRSRTGDLLAPAQHKEAQVLNFGPAEVTVDKAGPSSVQETEHTAPAVVAVCNPSTAEPEATMHASVDSSLYSLNGESSASAQECEEALHADEALLQARAMVAQTSEAVNAQGDKLKMLKQKVKVEKERADAAIKEREYLAQQLEVARQESEQAKQDAHEAQAERATAQESLQMEIAAAKENAAIEWQTSKAKLADTMTALHAQHAADLSAHASELSALEADLKEAEKVLGRLNGELEAAQSIAAQAAERHAEAMRHIDRNTEVVTQIGDRVLESNDKNYKATVKNQQALARLEADNDKLVSQVHVVRDLLLQNDKEGCYKAIIDQLHNIIAEISTMRSEALEHHAERKSQAAEIQRLHQKMENMQACIDAANAAAASMQSDNQRLEDAKSHAVTAAETARAENRQLREEKRGIQAEAESQRTQLAKAKQDEAVGRAELAAERAAREKLTEAISSSTRATEDKMATLVASFKKLQENLGSSAEAKTAQGLEADRRRRKSYEEFADNLKAVQDDKDNAQIIADTTAQLAALQARFEVLERECAQGAETRASLEQALREESIRRVNADNKIREMNGNIRVICRLRGNGGGEEACVMAVEVKDQFTVSLHDGKTSQPQKFEFDACFLPDASQEEVYAETQSLLQSAFDGYNVCIFCYGQTGSGKTHTMIGSAGAPGIIPRAATDIFADVANRSVDMKVSCYMVELYQTSLADLLAPRSRKRLAIKKDATGTVHVSEACVKEVASEEELLALVTEGLKSRRTAPTKMNSESSRSHLILTILIERTDLQLNTKTCSKVTLVDLAGSERVEKSGASEKQGNLMGEACAINSSLSQLGKVVTELTTGAGHVSYRDSKLTELLQDSLGGNAKTLMVVNVSPLDKDAAETKSSLTYATGVKQVTNNSSRSFETREIGKLKNDNAKLKRTIDDLRAQLRAKK